MGRKGLLLNREPGILHRAGWSCDNCLYLEVGSREFLITDGRYTTEAEEGVRPGVEVVEARDLVKKARELLLKFQVKQVKLDPLHWSVQEYRRIAQIAPIREIPNLSQLERKVKREEELEWIRKSARANREGFRRFLENLQLGADEYQLGYRLKGILTEEGRRPLSFEPIVAIDKNSAKPHAQPTGLQLKLGGVLLIDAGVKVGHYCSDRTRTIGISEKGLEEGFTDDKFKQHFSDPLQQRVYQVVLEAQLRAIDRVKVGVPYREIDRTAREVIEKAGFGGYFVHSTGHGVGLEIHELPIISPRGEGVIEEGVAFTIEPGIYLPGEFGVRIEDIVIVNWDGEVEVV
ncbi:MAG: M24 family metallopeptidase [Campylobacterales bacterium]